MGQPSLRILIRSSEQSFCKNLCYLFIKINKLKIFKEIFRFCARFKSETIVFVYHYPTSRSLLTNLNGVGGLRNGGGNSIVNLIKYNSLKLKNLTRVNFTEHKCHPWFRDENPTILAIQSCFVKTIMFPLPSRHLPAQS